MFSKTERDLAATMNNQLNMDCQVDAVAKRVNVILGSREIARRGRRWCFLSIGTSKTSPGSCVQFWCLHFN